jgi:Rps23 Pro-64 3,4-dihydroxylase Tpa1-like proline 4-hydroxylase
MELDRRAISEMVGQRISRDAHELRKQWATGTPVRYLVVDDLLPDDLVRSLQERLPDTDGMLSKSTLRERKRIGIDVGSYKPLVTEVLYAFQQTPVIDALVDITGLQPLVADPSLYAAGLSAMGQGDFLNPHVDNSHDRRRQPLSSPQSPVVRHAELVRRQRREPRAVGPESPSSDNCRLVV